VTLPGAATQSEPTAGSGPVVHELVTADIAARLDVGVATYGRPLRPHNGRDALVDAYQEALDLACYLRQAIYERDGR
jgi:hypothetical protein